MLTIDEIKNISFRKATLSGGYRAEDVDAFIDEVIATFEQQKKEKTNLVHKIDRLATRLEEYREDEETVRNALLTSQKMSDACIKEAKDKAARIIRDAEDKAQALVSEANNMTALEKEKYLQLQSDAVDLRNELIELYSKHIKSIDDFPTSSDVEKSKEELDAKYPTEPVQPAPVQPVPVQQKFGQQAQQYQPQQQYRQPQYEPQQQPVQAPVQAPVQQAPVQQAPVQAQPAQAPAGPRATEATTRVQLKRPGKFNQLKFGDNYDVSDE